MVSPLRGSPTSTGDGLRAWKQAGGNKTYFLYDGINVLCELDAAGAVIASSAYGANGLLSRGTAQYQFDLLGDAVLLLLDGAGNVTARPIFDAWGNPLTAVAGPHGYRARHGYYTDTETGLVALAYRYYAPGGGRFLNRDPIAVVVIGYTQMSYQYAENAPVTRLDPTGLMSEAEYKECIRGCHEQAALCVLVGITGCILGLAAGTVGCSYVPPPLNVVCQRSVWRIYYWCMATAAVYCSTQAGLCLNRCDRLHSVC